MTSGPSARRVPSTVLPFLASKPNARLAVHEAASGSASCMRESYRQQAAHSVGIHLGAAAARDDLATFHDEVLIGERAREVVILLDQQNRHLARGGERADRALDLLDDRGLDALGRLVEDEEP